MGRRRVHGDQTRLALLRAAEALVARNGISALSVRSVAAAVGTSTRAVYSVFGSKEALLRGLAIHAFELLMNAVDAIPLTDDPIADLHAGMVLGFRPFTLAHPELFRLALQWSPVRPDEGVIEASATALSRLIVRVERAQAAGLLPQRSPHALTLELAGVGNGLAGLELWGMPVDMDLIWHDTVGDVLRGLRADTHDHYEGEAV
jgi:AcrR family transcriptional regulator